MLELTQNFERKVTEHLEGPPELANVPPEILSLLPEKESLKKATRSTSQQDMATNSRTLADLVAEGTNQYLAVLQTVKDATAQYPGGGA